MSGRFIVTDCISTDWDEIKEKEKGSERDTERQTKRERERDALNAKQQAASLTFRRTRNIFRAGHSSPRRFRLGPRENVLHQRVVAFEVVTDHLSKQHGAGNCGRYLEFVLWVL